MPGDMVVALGPATGEPFSLFAHNSARPPREPEVLQLTPGRAHALGEKVNARFLELPEARQTFTVLGSQPTGAWGYTHGVNEHGVAVGCTSLRSKLKIAQAGLVGTDLVRLALERTRTALQALDLVTDLIERRGQGVLPGCPTVDETDSAFLIAAASEAFVVEAAGHHWACQEVQQVRAVSDVGTIHQDWVRISRGLSAHAIGQGWWPADGSKLDFASAVHEEAVGPASALRRWGRTTYLLEQQSGHIDVAFLRRLLADHYEGMQGEVDPFGSSAGPTPLCQHGAGGRITAASMVAPLHTDSSRPTLAWCAFGPPCVSVYFPVFLDAALPEAFANAGQQPNAASVWWRTQRLHEHLCRNPRRVEQASESMSRLQARFDQEAEEIAAEMAPLKSRREMDELQRRGSIYLQHCLERYGEALDLLLRLEYEPAGVAAETR
jgi:dipeptidase